MLLQKNYKNDYSSIIKFIFSIISLSSFNCVSLKLIEEIYSRKFSSQIINKLFEGIEYSIETLCIKPPYVIGLFGIYEIDENHKNILSDFNNDDPIQVLYRFLVKSKLIDSIKNIELEFTDWIDYELLFKLISEYKSKSSPDPSFCLSYKPSLDSEIYRRISDIYDDKIKNINHLITNKIDKKDSRFELLDKILKFLPNNSYDNSDKSKNKLITEVIKDDSPFMRSNKLQMLNRFNKEMKLPFLVYLLEAELSKPNGESSKSKIRVITVFNAD